MTGRGFSAYHLEYTKKASAKRATYRFCLHYYSTSSNYNQSTNRKGYFDNLHQYIATGLEVGNKEEGKRITDELEKGGISSFNSNKQEKIDALKIRTRSTKILS